MAALRKPKTEPRHSMPPQGDRPGHKIGRHNLRYWIAKNVVRDIKGFPDKCIALPIGASDEEVNALCKAHTARLLAYLDNPAALPEEPQIAYDGTIRSICRTYRTHPRSPFHTVKKKNTKRYYEAYLDLLEATVGARLVRNIDIFTVQYWYDEWRKPAEPEGAERVDRAHDAVSMLRTVVNFCSKLKNFAGRKHCKELAEDLKGVKFEKGGAREQEMTAEHVRAFIDKALEMGAKDLLPMERARSMAIGVAAQFETLLRQKDIIGEWCQKADAPRLPKGATVQQLGREIWWGFFTWESIPAWRWRMKTSKSKYRSAAVFTLSNYPLLVPLLETVPHAERTGAVVKGEKGLPVRETTYRETFRRIATAAGIPEDVWLMDSRAGGATEASIAKAPIGAISGALTHTDQKTTVRYLRRGATADIEEVAKARAAHRKAQDGQGE